MPRIEQTARNWIAALFDREIAAIEAQDTATVERIRRARATLESFAADLP